MYFNTLITTLINPHHPPRGCLKSAFLMDLTFELLCAILGDPLWFNDLYFTTKSHQGATKVRKGLFRHPLGRGKNKGLVVLLNQNQSNIKQANNSINLQGSIK
jgi:hypothetical protein